MTRSVRWANGLILFLGLLASASTPAHGQRRPLTARGQQDLMFGTLIPGVSTTVSRFDAANAGLFELRGRRSAEVQIDLTLPAALTAGGGANVPLQFGSADGGFSTSPDVSVSRAFDPRVPLVTRLAGNGKLYIFLGGTALPGGQQAPGAYAATITVTLAYTGN